MRKKKVCRSTDMQLMYGLRQALVVLTRARVNSYLTIHPGQDSFSLGSYCCIPTVYSLFANIQQRSQTLSCKIQDWYDNCAWELVLFLLMESTRFVESARKTSWWVVRGITWSLCYRTSRSSGVHCWRTPQIYERRRHCGMKRIWGL